MHDSSFADEYRHLDLNGLIDKSWRYGEKLKSVIKSKAYSVNKRNRFASD